VDLLVQAAVLRIEAAREARVVAEVTASQLYQVHIAGLRRAQAADRDNASMASHAPKALTPQERHFADQIDGLLERVKRIETAPARCPETWQPAVGGDVGRCTLPTGHTGKHLMASQSGVPWAHPGEVCHDSPTARGELASGLTEDEAGRRAQATQLIDPEFRAVTHVVCSQAYQETRRDEPADGLHED